MLIDNYEVLGDATKYYLATTSLPWKNIFSDKERKKGLEVLSTNFLAFTF